MLGCSLPQTVARTKDDVQLISGATRAPVVENFRVEMYHPSFEVRKNRAALFSPGRQEEGSYLATVPNPLPVIHAEAYHFEDGVNAVSRRGVIWPHRHILLPKSSHCQVVQVEGKLVQA